MTNLNIQIILNIGDMVRIGPNGLGLPERLAGEIVGFIPANSNDRFPGFYDCQVKIVDPDHLSSGSIFAFSTKIIKPISKNTST